MRLVFVNHHVVATMCLSPKLQPFTASGLEDGAWYWDHVDGDGLAVVLVAELQECLTWSHLEDALVHGSAGESVVSVLLADISFPVDVDQGAGSLDGWEEVLVVEVGVTTDHGQEVAVRGGQRAVWLDLELLSVLTVGTERDSVTATEC